MKRPDLAPLLVMPGAPACSVHAVDGVILINSKAALSGGIVPFDEPEFPETTGLQGSYRLTSGLVPDRNTDIRILASDVNIDLNEFTITGAVESNGGGIGISGFGTLSGNHAQANHHQGISASCPFATVVWNAANGNAGGDIFTSASGCTRANNTQVP